MRARLHLVWSEIAVLPQQCIIILADVIFDSSDCVISFQTKANISDALLEYFDILTKIKTIDSRHRIQETLDIRMVKRLLEDSHRVR